jgi:hypothetical protein
MWVNGSAMVNEANDDDSFSPRLLAFLKAKKITNKKCPVRKK